MDYKEKIKNDIKDKETEELWEAISSSFEEDGSAGIKLLLDDHSNEFFDNYISALKDLKRLL